MVPSIRLAPPEVPLAPSKERGHAERLDRPDLVAPRSDFYPGLDLLRGFAAISVVIYHVIFHYAWKSFPSDNVVALWFHIGWMGVDLFFVISGFVIALSALKLLDHDAATYARTYCTRRLARIVPLHYLTCLLAVIFVTPAILFDPDFPWHALAHLSFTHNWAHETAGSINGPNWSLAIEMQFYLLILVAAPWLRRMRPLTVLGACVAIAWSWRAAAFALYEGQVRDGVNMTWLAIAQVPGQLDLFGWGIVLAMFVRSDAAGRWIRALHPFRWLWPVATWLVATVTMKLFWMDGSYWGNWYLVVYWRSLLGLTMLLAVISVCALDDRWLLVLTAPLRYLGTISYGIYLWHSLVLFALRPVLLGEPLRACLWIVGLTLLLSSLSWHFFEKPLMERFGWKRARSAGAAESTRFARTTESAACGREGVTRGDRIGQLELVLPAWAQKIVAWGALPLFAFVSFWPALRRLGHATLLGDDIIRVVHLERLSFVDHLFQPFSTHITPLFQVVSWLTWQSIGHDLRSAPLGFCVASIAPWALVLILLACWLVRETGSRTASLAAVALVAQSPLVLEAVWWYSASSFLWAIAGILVAVLGAGALARRPRGAIALIGIGTTLGSAATTLGILAAPLSILRAVCDTRSSRRVKLLAILAALAGVCAHVWFSSLPEIGVVRLPGPRKGMPIWPLTGLGYAMTVPGRLLWPSIAGVPASWASSPLPAWPSWVAGALALFGLAVLLFWPRPAWNRRLVLCGGAMIYLGYLFVYPARFDMIKAGLWTESQFLYQFAGRYHVLPLIGAAATIAALLSAWPLCRRCDQRRGLAASIGLLVGLSAFLIQHKEAATWEWMLHQPDQKATFKVLHRVGDLARQEGIPRSQLVRVFDPCFRSWNGSVLGNHPDSFPLMALVVAAPGSVEHPLPDPEARQRILSHLTRYERTVLGAGACMSLNPSRPGPGAQTVAVGRRVEIYQANEVDRGRYQGDNGDSYIEFEFDPARTARFLELPGLKADQDVLILRNDEKGRWRAGLNVRWLSSPRRDGTAAIDIERPIHWPPGPIPRIRIQFTRPGEIALTGPPRLLR